MTGLAVTDLCKSYPAAGGGRREVLKGVSLRIDKGECVGLIGESGSGKSTLIRCALGLEKPDSGRVDYEGSFVHEATGPDLLLFRREVQIVFQDPFASLNPRMTVEELVGEGLLVHRIEPSRARRRACVAELLGRVGLEADAMHRYPRAFSGGQRQRIAIARALAVSPRILVCDEPVSALDVSVQAQVINLLADMRSALGLGILFVAHDIGVVRYLCDSVLVLAEGRVVEEGPTETVFGDPQHDYTRALMAAAPVPDPAEAKARRALRRQQREAARGSEP
ncbi:ATP-binding cassette domain-containing protein [Mesorhizobium sp. BR1-1-16]|uniref:ATP-binding cassette domain-containing protein n=1 Tax=Mesorhizobium sp. BR1-1-16 TaxID=2876653 RepID=UPI001CCFB7E8|nr:ATP-binding cassette domain-containing protein [Mesorhizobium sp. BR1-1-16]MBZ9939413.1 ATP-binding cassette domain-containing protein [Mesorhizobium sp. BR1-1-16]